MKLLEVQLDPPPPAYARARRGGRVQSRSRCQKGLVGGGGGRQDLTKVGSA